MWDNSYTTKKIESNNYATIFKKLTVFLLLLNIRVVSAANWDITPSLILSTSYNDNIFLSPPGEEEGDYVWQINPGITAIGDGKRANMSLYALMQNVYYAEQSEYDDTFYQLNALGNAEVISNLFFLDATAGHTQQIITRDAPIPINNVTISPNRTNVNFASLSPYLRSQLSSDIVGELRYREEKISYSTDLLTDYTVQSINADIRTTEEYAGRTNWALHYENRKVLPVTNIDSKIENVLLDVDYNLTQQIGLLAGGGYENNEYETSSSVTRILKGPIWYVGTRWSPNLNTSLIIRIGERRAYGKTLFVDWSHVTRKWNWNITYREYLETSGEVLISNQETGGINEPIVRPGDPLPRAEVSYTKRFDFSTVYDYGKTRLSFGLFHRNRDYQTSEREEILYGGQADWLWRLRARTELTLGARYQKEDVELATAKDNLWLGTIKIDHHLTREMLLWLEYGHYARDSTDPLRFAYNQNQATIGFLIQF